MASASTVLNSSPLPSQKGLVPFVGVGATWILFLMIPSAFSEDYLTAIRWVLLLSGLCLIDLLALHQAVRGILGVMNPPRPEHRISYVVQTLFWGTFKLVCLGFIGIALLQAKDAPGWTLAMSLGTLIVVPLAGGYLWSQKELKNA